MTPSRKKLLLLYIGFLLMTIVLSGMNSTHKRIFFAVELTALFWMLGLLVLILKEKYAPAYPTPYRAIIIFMASSLVAVFFLVVKKN